MQNIDANVDGKFLTIHVENTNVIGIQNFKGIKSFREHGTTFDVHKNLNYKLCHFSIVTNDFSPPSILILA